MRLKVRDSSQLPRSWIDRRFVAFAVQRIKEQSDMKIWMSGRHPERGEDSVTGCPEG
jgi:hypothetical protein